MFRLKSLSLSQFCVKSSYLPNRVNKVIRYRQSLTLTKKIKNGIMLVMNCNQCKLQNQPNIAPIIFTPCDIVYIIDKPDTEDIAHNILLSPKSKRGKFFFEEIQQIPDKSYSILSVVECYYSDKLTTSVYKHCAGGLPALVAQLQPKLIVCLGEIPAKVLLGLRGVKKNLGLHNWQGIPTIITLSPAYPCHEPVEDHLRIWKQSFLPVIRFFKTTDSIRYLTKDSPTIQGLQAIDIETSGLNPYIDKLKSFAVSNGKETEFCLWKQQ